MITTTHTGYICKACSQPAPMGVGYPVHTQEAQEASESVSVCQCGQSVAPSAGAAQVRKELINANRAIKTANALVVEDDGFTWIDGSIMGAEFMGFYGRLTSAAYALGAV